MISNAVATLDESMGMISKRAFAETKPISTYLFAFAVGPFQPEHHVDGLPDVYVRRSQLARAQSEIPAVQETAADGIKFFSSYFAQPFPFPKYDMVLLPASPSAAWNTRAPRFSMKIASCSGRPLRKTIASAATL